MHYVICCPPIIPHLAQNLSQAGITSQSNTAFLYAGAEMTQIEKVEYVDDNFPVNAHERCCYTTLDAPSHFVYQFIHLPPSEDAIKPSNFLCSNFLLWSAAHNGIKLSHLQ